MAGWRVGRKPLTGYRQQSWVWTGAFPWSATAAQESRDAHPAGGKIRR